MDIIEHRVLLVEELKVRIDHRATETKRYLEDLERALVSERVMANNYTSNPYVVTMNLLVQVTGQTINYSSTNLLSVRARDSMASLLTRLILLSKPNSNMHRIQDDTVLSTLKLQRIHKTLNDATAKATARAAAKAAAKAAARAAAIAVDKVAAKAAINAAIFAVGRAFDPSVKETDDFFGAMTKAKEAVDAAKEAVDAIAAVDAIDDALAVGEHLGARSTSNDIRSNNSRTIILKIVEEVTKQLDNLTVVTENLYLTPTDKETLIRRVGRWCTTDASLVTLTYRSPLCLSSQ